MRSESRCIPPSIWTYRKLNQIIYYDNDTLYNTSSSTLYTPCYTNAMLAQRLRLTRTDANATTDAKANAKAKAGGEVKANANHNAKTNTSIKTNTNNNANAMASVIADMIPMLTLTLTLTVMVTLTLTLTLYTTVSYTVGFTLVDDGPTGQVQRYWSVPPKESPLRRRSDVAGADGKSQASTDSCLSLSRTWRRNPGGTTWIRGMCLSMTFPASTAGGFLLARTDQWHGRTPKRGTCCGRRTRAEGAPVKKVAGFPAAGFHTEILFLLAGCMWLGADLMDEERKSLH